MSQFLNLIEASASKIARIVGVENVHLIDALSIQGLLLSARAEPPAIGKAMSIRAARRNRGRVMAALRWCRIRREGSVAMSRRAMDGIWWEGSRS